MRSGNTYLGGQDEGSLVAPFQANSNPTENIDLVNAAY